MKEEIIRVIIYSEVGAILKVMDIPYQESGVTLTVQENLLALETRENLKGKTIKENLEEWVIIKMKENAEE
jgi:hypothetical protein